MVAVIEAKESPYAIANEVLEAGIIESWDVYRMRGTHERNSGL
jgi:hypothetical protein